jgi:c-di-GMP phosphodiesterase
MQETTILDQIALGYSPFIDRNRVVSATRLTVFPLRTRAPFAAMQLLNAVAQVWPADGGQVSLNITSEPLLQNLLASAPSSNLMIEIPAFMACDPVNLNVIRKLHAAGNMLLIKGRPAVELPRELLPCFRYSIVALADDRRIGEVSVPEGVSRGIGYIQSGVRTVAEMQASFQRNAHAVLGWPVDDLLSAPVGYGFDPAQGDMLVIAELIHRVDRAQPIDKVVQTLKRGPSLAYKLMRHINSPAFGLPIEISSFRQAVTVLGYARLKQWLVSLLSTANKDPNLKPVLFTAMHRGMLMEELMGQGCDEDLRNEMFVCGAFSLLDRTFHKSFKELLDRIPVPQRVYDALVHDSGPFQPYMNLVRAIEAESLLDFREAAEAAMLSVSDINQAILRALINAHRA